MKVALLFPGITEGGFRCYGDEPNSSWHSHGLCSISSCLKAANHQVFLIDLRRLTGWDEYREKVTELKPDIICITMMSCTFNSALRSAELAHQYLPSVKVIVGGPHPSILPEEVAGYHDFDYILKGEGEISIVEMLSSIEHGEKLLKITLGKIPDLDKIPFVDRELLAHLRCPIPSKVLNPLS